MNEGVNLENLTKEETIVKFERMQSYIVPAGGKHQIVHNESQEDIAIAISKNGRKDFRKYDTKKVYWYTNPYAYVTMVPMTSQGIAIDLSHLV